MTVENRIPPLLCLVASFLALGVAAWCPPSPSAAQSADASSAPADSSLCAFSSQALGHASAVRELKAISSVPCVVEDKAAVSRFIQDTIREDLPPEKLAMEELAYRAVGLLPDSFDYQHGLVGFLVSQIGGYYNPKKKLFVMAGWLPASVQEGVAVHELTHALQDQHYNLSLIINAKNATTDSGLAASALIEGDASAVMFDYERRAQGQGRLQSAQSIEPLLLLQILGIGLGSEVPESLKSLLVFPYTSGLRFVHELLKAGGYERVHQAYSRIPSTTREILHPEEYLKRSIATQIPADAELRGRPEGVVPEYTDVLGEFGISVLFRGALTTRDRGVSAAVGWVGDKLGVLPVRDGVRTVSWLTRWESEGDATEFANLYRQFLEGVYSVRMGTGVVALNTTRSATVMQTGREVSIVIQERAT